MPGLLIGVRQGMPLFYEKPTVAFNSLHFQAPMQCKSWDNRAQAKAELCLFNPIPLTSSHCLFPPFSAVCGGPLILLTLAMCFHFRLWSQLCDQRGTKYKLNSNRSQAALWSRPFRRSPLAATRSRCRPPTPPQFGHLTFNKTPSWMYQQATKRQSHKWKSFRWPENIKKSPGPEKTLERNGWPMFGWCGFYLLS